MNNVNLKTLILRPVKNNVNEKVISYAIIKPLIKQNQISVSFSNLFDDLNEFNLVCLCEDKNLVYAQLNCQKKEQVITLPTLNSPICAMIIATTNGREPTPLLFGEYSENKTNLTNFLKIYAQKIKKTQNDDTSAKSNSPNTPPSSDTQGSR